MHFHSFILLGLCACQTTQAYWWRHEDRECKKHTVYVERTHTVTETKTASCSVFGTSTHHTSSGSTSSHSASTTHSPSSTSHSPSSTAHAPSSSTHTSSSSSHSTTHTTSPSSSHTSASSPTSSSHSASPSSSAGSSTSSSSHSASSSIHSSTSSSHSGTSSSHIASNSASTTSSHSISSSTSASSSASSSPSVSLSISASIPNPLSTSSSSSAAIAPSATPFLILGTAPTNPLANDNYAVIAIGGSMGFTSTDPSTASSFTVDASGHLLYNNLYAQVGAATNGVSEVLFVNPVSALSKAKRQAGTTPLTCTVTAGVNGNAALTCVAAGQTVPQACGTSYYLGSDGQCAPLVLASLSPTTATTTTGSGGTGTAPPSAQFSLYYNGFYAGYFTPSSGPGTELAFAVYGHGSPFTLDASGHLLSVGPTASGAVVTYAAVFEVGATSGPIVEQSGVIPSGYVAIVCSIDAVTNVLSCADGATGTNTVLQFCNGSDILMLGTALGAGCTAYVQAVSYTS